MMRRTLFISTLVFALLCGCVKNDEYAPEKPKSAISFNEPIVKNISKATGEINGLYPIDESFTVFSVYHDSGFNGWESGVTYINGAQFSYDPSVDDDDADDLGGWTGGYFFPNNGGLSFAAYSPFRAHAAAPGDGTGVFAYGQTGLTITDFSVPADPASQYDLMYSERLYDKTDNDGVGDGYEGLDLVFHHALSSIRFRVRKAEEYPGNTITLTKITVSKVKYKGDFAENITNETSSSYESSPVWAVDESNIPTGYTIFDGTLEITRFGADNYHDLSQGAILMPQVYKSGSSVINPDAAITIEYTVNNGSLTVTQEATIKLNTLSDKWEMGKRYIYNITLGYDKITVAPTVSGWTEVNAEATIK